jgi:plastocyanin
MALESGIIKKLGIGLIVACVIAGAAAYGFFIATENSLSEPDRKEHVVTLTEDGFSPADITIRTGEVVTFVTQGDRPFWPASDLHPTHSLYAEFDPKMPILPEKSWSMHFDTAGRFKYHDHLDPQKAGLISVLPSISSFFKKDVPCEDQLGSAKLRCFDMKLEASLQEGGIESAFAYFKEIYAADPEVPSQCHQWAHRLGEAEYALYKEGQKIELRPEAAFCSYGYFHGFINAMVADTQNFLSAQQFCEDAVRDTKDQLKGMAGNCIHGIGHSVATLMLEDQKQWGSVQGVLEAGAAQCTELYADLQGTCFDGMFHELYLSMSRGDYGLQVDEYAQSGDLFYYCKGLPSELSESCHAEFIKLWPYFLGSDKKTAIEHLAATVEGVFVQTPRVLHTLARSFIEMDIVGGDFKGSVEACAAVPEYLFNECLHGLVLGFVTHGEPGSMHEAGFAFCRDQYEGESRAVCIEDMVAELSLVYFEEQLHAACMQLDESEKPSTCL